MTSRKPAGPARPKPKAAVNPGITIPPVVPSTAEAKRAAAKEAVSRLAKMTPEEQAAALFQSMGGLKKR